MTAAALGVLGGMGPLASARFVSNLYELNPAGREQDLPRVLLDSDPAMPDRTAAILTGRTEEVADRLSTRIRGLLTMGATRVVVPCFTAHHFLPLIDPRLRALVVSLVDVTIGEVNRAQRPLLMLSTAGTRSARIFERAQGWSSVADRVVLPDAEDQEKIHRLIYQIKRQGASSTVLTEIDALRRRSQCTGVIAGCTEFHLVSRDLVGAYGAANVVDALLSVAAGVRRVLDTGQPRAEVDGRTQRIVPV